MKPKKPLAPLVRNNDGPIVFVVQNQHKWDPDLQKFVPKFNLEPALLFGDLFTLLSPTASPFNFETVKDELNFRLRHYREGDYILCVGNPILIGATFAMVAYYNNGRVAGLQWSGKDQRYIPIQLFDLGVEEDEESDLVQAG